jgi:UrcA family protein
LASLALLGSSNVAGATMIDSGMHGSSRIIVSTHDLDLATDAGIRAARARVRRAAARACDAYPHIGILPSAESERCRIAAVRQADARIVTLASRMSRDRLVSAGMDSRMR